MDTDETMIGTGRMNRTGGTATITMPKDAVEEWDLDENGLDVVWFYDGQRMFVVPQSEVTVNG